jgi:hypothetical protein
MSTLDTAARALPDADEGLACIGTALESRTYLVNKKAFLFVGKKEARLKLETSIDEATRLGFAVGSNGWVKLPLDGLPPAPVVRRWVKESHGLVAGADTRKTGAGKPKASRKPGR